MTPLGALPAAGDQRAQPGLDRRWLALGFVALAQLMIALDATVVSVALPTVQRALGGSDAERAWIVAGYSVSFGGLLLLGGRISDAIGRRRAFQIGLLGFALGSALGGAATSVALLIVARVLQGAFAALLSPSALALLTLMFRERHERARAFAVFGGVAGSGGAVGLVASGWLTQSASWRWCLYVNVALAMVAAVGARATLVREPAGVRQRIDLTSALFVSFGLALVVYGCGAALARGWTSTPVLLSVASGLVCIARFVVRQRYGAAPLLPLHLVLDRNRGGAALSAALAIVAMFGLFLLLTYYFQAVEYYSPLQAGLAFLPMSAASLFGSTFVAGHALPHVQPRVVLVGGLLIAAAGLSGLTRMSAGMSYASGIMPCEIAVGFGVSCAMITAINVATYGVAPHDAGIASALIASAQQLGASLGTALLNSVAASATAVYLRIHSTAGQAQALVQGYVVATAWGCAILLAAAAIASVLVNAPRPARLAA